MILLLGDHDRIWLRVAADAIRVTARRDGLRPPPWVDDLECAASAGLSGTTSAAGEEVGDSALVPLVYRPDEAAEVLRVTPRTVNRLIAAGELRAFRVLKDRGIARDDLIAFMERPGRRLRPGAGVLKAKTPALGRCPKCKSPGAGPLVHRGYVHVVCDVDAVLWPLALSPREASRLNATRLGYAGVENR